MAKVVYRHVAPVTKIKREVLIENLENARLNYERFYRVAKEDLGEKALTASGYFPKDDMSASLTVLINQLRVQRGRTPSELARDYRVVLKKLQKIMPGKGEHISEKTGKRWGRTTYQEFVTHQTDKVWQQYLDISEQTNPGSSDFLNWAKDTIGVDDATMRAFLKSEQNVDLSHVTWDSEGLIEFENTYGMSLETARFLDFLGYDYKSMGGNGELVKKVIIGR